MGSVLAQRLLTAGAEVRVWNRTPGHSEELAAQGALVAESVPDAMSGAVAVFTSLSGDEGVREVLLPGDRARPELTGFLVDTSTVSPAISQALSDAYGVRFLAGPIAGAPPVLAAGHAQLLLAGPETTRNALGPVLDAISDKQLVVGDDPPRAAVVKLLNNYLLLAGLAALADVVATGQSVGLTDEDLRRVLGSLPVISPGLAPRVDALLGREHPPAFTVALGRKDLRLASALGRESGRSLGLLPAIVERYEQAAELGLDARDISANVETLRRSV